MNLEKLNTLTPFSLSICSPQKGRLVLNYECSLILSCFKNCQSTIIKNQFWQSQQGAVRSCPGLVACWLSTWAATRQCNIAKPVLTTLPQYGKPQQSQPRPALTSLLSVNVKGRRKVTFVLLLPTSHTSLCPPSQAGSPIIESNNECCCLDYRYPMFWQLSMTHESFLLLTSFETCSISGI